MKITMIGTGYVGLVSGTCFADLGNDVICLDIDEDKIKSLNSGEIPIYEPGLGELVARNKKEGRLKFTTDKKLAIESSDIIFICVGTPQKHNGEANLDYIFAAAKDIAINLNKYKIIIDKSTVPVGTAEKVSKVIKQNSDIEFDVVSNPEFLREGAAIKDFQNPDRVVIGTNSDKAKEILTKLYSSVIRVGKPIMFTDIKSAELIKYASNAMLATRISFMNELSQLAEVVGADIKQISKGMGLDSRIGPRFLQAGAGYGGSCFPKDVRALAQSLEGYGLTSNILMAVDYTNERQKKSIIPKLKKHILGLEGKKIAIWGLAFKPRTDDIREASSLTVISQLEKEYARVSVYDPEAMENTKVLYPDIEYTNNPYDAVKDADAVILMTEWDVFRSIDLRKVKELMNGNIFIDGRNIYSPDEIKKYGFNYLSVGRG